MAPAANASTQGMIPVTLPATRTVKRPKIGSTTPDSAPQTNALPLLTPWLRMGRLTAAPSGKFCSPMPMASATAPGSAAALLSCAALGKNPPFFGEFTVRHPEDKNVELLWHCGPFAYSLKKPGTVAREENQRQWFQVKDGKFTICRFDQDDGHYQLLNGTLESADGPYTFGTYLWARFNNLTKWERKLIDGPYIHHMAEVEGDYTWELREFCRLIPHLDSDTVD